MFKRTKRRIVFAVVFSLLALMTVTLTTIYISNRMAIRRENDEMLAIYAERFTLEDRGEELEERGAGDIPGTPDRAGPPELPGGDRYGRNEPAFRLSTFYSVAYSKEGEVLAVNKEQRENEDTEHRKAHVFLDRQEVNAGQG